MKTKSFATFGLFLKGELIESGEMAELMTAAQKYAESEPLNKVSIGSMVFSDGEDIQVTEGVKIMSYFSMNNEIYIINELI